jgi:tight adherence protein C
MEKVVLAAASFLFFMFAAAGAFLVLFKGKIQVDLRVQRLLTGEETGRSPVRGAREEANTEEVKLPFRERVFKPLRHKFRSFMVGKMSTNATRALEKKLSDAGYPFQMTAADFRSLQLILGTGFFLFILLLFLTLSKDWGRVLVFSCISGIFGAMYPNYYVNAKRKQRIVAIQKAMPDFFDMVNVSIEAGMGLDASIA